MYNPQRKKMINLTSLKFKTSTLYKTIKRKKRYGPDQEKKTWKCYIQQKTCIQTI